MNLTDIIASRLINQHIAQTESTSAKAVVYWMGAIQAQDYAMAKWAIGVRLANSNERLIQSALDNGEIIRTHMLRTTWHFVSSADIYWMLDLRADQIKSSLRTRQTQLGLSESIFAKSNAILETALRGGTHLIREEILTALGNVGISLDENRAAHLLMRAELDGVLSNGVSKGGKLTYALLEERVPKTKALTREEALIKLARVYFSSHGPATLADFVWWSGLSIKDAKHSLELLGGDFISETIDAQTYWFTNFISSPGTNLERVYLLPAFDEFFISYKDRRGLLSDEDLARTVSDNGIFRPIVVVNGQIVGIWKRTIKKEKVIVGVELFHPAGQTTKSLIEKAAVQYGQFLGKETEIRVFSSSGN